jgi:hypothetical protein
MRTGEIKTKTYKEHRTKERKEDGEEKRSTREHKEIKDRTEE